MVRRAQRAVDVPATGGNTWRRAGAGLVAGLIGGLTMALVLLLLRVVAGVPLPVELVSDRLIPQLPVRTFVRLLGRVGGPLRGKELAFLTSFGAQLVGTAIGGTIYGLVAGRRRASLAGGVAVALLWLAFVVGLWPVLESNYRGLGPEPARLLGAFGLAVGFAAYAVTTWAVLDRWSAGRSPSPEGRRVSRRAVLLGGAGAVAALASGGLAGYLYRRATFGSFGYDGMQLRGPQTMPITPNDRFYVVTKNLIDPVVSDSVWRLQIAGLVERPRSYSSQDLAALPSVRQEQTLECISNRVGSGLISNAVWTGVPLSALLGPARPNPGANRVLLHAADGYVHAISAGKAMESTTLVAYRMNGQPLPQRHGYPARVLVPGTYGEVNVKWVDRIELTDRPEEGYYEKQGWKPYFVSTTSRFDWPRSGQHMAGGILQLRGIAFAGNRGISKVEVSADGGKAWEPAAIVYRGTRLTWALWALDWRPPQPGSYSLVVRATDGDGNVQTEQARGAVPAGATGYHQVRIQVTG